MYTVFTLAFSYIQNTCSCTFLHTPEYSCTFLHAAVLRIPNFDVFLGFLIVVQDKNEQNGGIPYGEFLLTDSDMKGVRCKTENSGVTHTIPDFRNEISDNWKPPASCNLDSVLVRATVVYEYSSADHVRTTYNF